MTGIDRRREQVSIRFAGNAAIDAARLAEFVAAEHTRGAHFSPAGVLQFTLRAGAASEVLARLQELLGQLAAEPAAVVSR